MARKRTKAPLWKERFQKVKGRPFVVRVFSGETDDEWEEFVESLPNYARKRIGPICPHYRTADGAFNWSSYEWPVECTELSLSRITSINQASSMSTAD